MPEECGKRQRWPVLHEEFHNATDADLFLVREVFEPPGEFVGALDLPCHHLNMPLDDLCVKGYTLAVNLSALFDGRAFCEAKDFIKATTKARPAG